MKEDFLHYVWQYQLFDQQELKSSDGKLLQIVDKGQSNTNAGPDFFNAKIKIDETLWAGNIEIHIKASHWQHHKHQQNRAYDNVILVALKWQQLQSHLGWIACEKSLHTIDDFTWIQWKNRLIVERLEAKTASIETLLQQSNNNWDQCFFIFLAKSFGMKINQLPFEQLAQSIPFNLIHKHSTQALQIEALFFGQAGFLNDTFTEYYPLQLQQEYKFLKAKYQLNTLRKETWKFAKLRPANFPTIRIAQLAALLQKQPLVFSQILKQKNLQGIINLFDCEMHPYWQRHYHFKKTSKRTIKSLGQSIIRSIIINCVVPFIFIYEKLSGQSAEIEDVFSLLEQLPAENNRIINQWEILNVGTKNAWDTQSLLHLKTQYCTHKKCLHCAIAHSILNETT